MIKRLKYWLRSFDKIKTVEQAQKMGLFYHSNVYGDEINRSNCRSWWIDIYGHSYRCAELYKDIYKLEEDSPLVLPEAKIPKKPKVEYFPKDYFIKKRNWDKLTLDDQVWVEALCRDVRTDVTINDAGGLLFDLIDHQISEVVGNKQ